MKSSTSCRRCKRWLEGAFNAAKTEAEREDLDVQMKQGYCHGCFVVVQLIQQLNEDERLARAAPGHSWQAQDDDSIAGTSVYDEQWRLLEAEHHGHNDPLSNRPGATGPAYVDAARDDLVNHIARHDPARVLADVAIKRNLLELHADRNGYCNECGGAWPCLTLQYIAEGLT